jgi:hypothetical protein
MYGLLAISKLSQKLISLLELYFKDGIRGRDTNTLSSRNSFTFDTSDARFFGEKLSLGTVGLFFLL